MIEIDEYFTEIIDEGRGTIGYYLISYKDKALVKAIYKHNKKLEKIKEMCKNAISECSCKNPNKDVDCFECTLSWIKSTWPRR